MFRPDKGAKLMDRLERDAEGNPTGKIRGKPTYDVMLAPGELSAEELEALEPYRHHPEHIDDSFAQTETWYYRFTTEAECRAKLARFLSTAEQA